MAIVQCSLEYDNSNKNGKTNNSNRGVNNTLRKTYCGRFLKMSML